MWLAKILVMAAFCLFLGALHPLLGAIALLTWWCLG